MLSPNVLVLTGEGINCERETAMAFKEVGGSPTVMTLNELIKKPAALEKFHILAIPGGFSYGDEIGSGQVFSIKLKKYLSDELDQFVKDGKPIIGICNGFQILMKFGIFQPNQKRTMGLAPNTSGHFINKWADLVLEESSPCIWTKGLSNSGSLPIRHGEGKIVFQDDQKDLPKNQVVLSYKNDENGSFEKIAGVCDPTGLVFGLMPHPEADLYKVTHSSDVNSGPFETSWGYGIFKNAINYIQSNQEKWS